MSLVIEIKRSNFKVVYKSDKRAWLPRDLISRVQAPADSPFLSRLNFLLKRVRAHECELVSHDGVHRLAARIDHIDHIAVNELRDFLGSDFVSLAVVPEGMAFMQLEIEFRL